FNNFHVMAQWFKFCYRLFYLKLFRKNNCTSILADCSNLSRGFWQKIQAARPLAARRGFASQIHPARKRPKQKPGRAPAFIFAGPAGKNILIKNFYLLSLKHSSPQPAVLAAASLEAAPLEAASPDDASLEAASLDDASPEDASLPATASGHPPARR